MSLVDPLRQFVESDDAAKHVEQYFETRDDATPWYTGARFDTLAGGGDRPDAKDQFTPDDILAVTFLSVSVPAPTAIWMLEEGSAALSELLARVPIDVDLWDAPTNLVVDESAADELWRLLRDRDGIGWVTAGKLMARKRPRLIPVYDSVVREALGSPKKYWLELREALRTEPRIVERLGALRRDAGISDVSLLRILDTVIWMHQYGYKFAKGS